MVSLDHTDLLKKISRLFPNDDAVQSLVEKQMLILAARMQSRSKALRLALSKIYRLFYRKINSLKNGLDKQNVLFGRMDAGSPYLTMRCI